MPWTFHRFSDVNLISMLMLNRCVSIQRKGLVEAQTVAPHSQVGEKSENW